MKTMLKGLFILFLTVVTFNTFLSSYPWYAYCIPKVEIVYLIEGNKHILASELQKKIPNNSYLWLLDISKLEQELIQDFAYIKKIKIRRYFPNMIKIQIEEYNFIAQHQGYLLSIDAEYVKKRFQNDFSDLPVVIGTVLNYLHVVVDIIKDVTDLSMQITRIKRREYGGWTVLIEGIEVDLSHETPMLDLKIFAKWYEHNKKRKYTHVCIRGQLVSYQ